MALGLSRPAAQELVQYDATALKVLGIYCLVKFEKFPESSVYIHRAREYDRYKGRLQAVGPRPHEDIKDVPLGTLVYINRQTQPKAEFGWDGAYYGLFDSNDIAAKNVRGWDIPECIIPLGPLVMVKRVFDKGLVNGVYRPEAATKNVLRGTIVNFGERVSEEARQANTGDVVSFNGYAMRFFTMDYEGETYDIFNSEDIEAVGG